MKNYYGWSEQTQFEMKMEKQRKKAERFRKLCKVVILGCALVIVLLIWRGMVV